MERLRIRDSYRMVGCGVDSVERLGSVTKPLDFKVFNCLIF